MATLGGPDHWQRGPWTLRRGSRAGPAAHSHPHEARGRIAERLGCRRDFDLCRAGPGNFGRQVALQMSAFDVLAGGTPEGERMGDALDAGAFTVPNTTETGDALLAEAAKTNPGAFGEL